MEVSFKGGICKTSREMEVHSEEKKSNKLLRIVCESPQASGRAIEETPTHLLIKIKRKAEAEGEGKKQS